MNNTETELIVVRTHFYNHSLDLFVQELEARSGRKIVIAADEASGTIAVPPTLDKVSVRPDQLGLPAPNDAMWRCGDYNLYAVADRYPDTKRFWLLEPDIRIHGTDLRGFFDGPDTDTSADFVTPWFVESSPQWMWYGLMRPFSSRVFNCMLQISRFSMRAIQVLKGRRKMIATTFADRQMPLSDWPNDEAFVGGSLHDAGMKIRTFEQHAPDYQLNGTFTFLKPTSLQWLKTQPFDKRLYHPVVEGDKFIKRANLYLDDRRAAGIGAPELADTFGRDFVDQVRIEGGEGAVARFVIKLQNAMLAYGGG